MATVSIGRSRLPPELMRWLATSGIIVTSEPVRDKMVVLTRSISAATSLDSGSMDARGDSNGTTTANAGLRIHDLPAVAATATGQARVVTGKHRNAMLPGQVWRCASSAVGAKLGTCVN